MPAMRREFGLVLLLGAAGAGLVVFALRQTWAQAIFTPPRPLPAQAISVTGQQLVPLAGALLAVLGAAAAAAAAAGVQESTVLAAARAQAAAGALGGSTTSGTSPGGTVHAIVIAGSTGHAVMAAAPWPAAAVCGAVAIVLAGLATVWRGPRWPVMSARYERQPARPRGTDSAGMWESLSRDVDPTVDDGTRT